MIEDALGTDVGAVNAYRKLASDDSIVAIVGPTVPMTVWHSRPAHWNLRY